MRTFEKTPSREEQTVLTEGTTMPSRMTHEQEYYHAILLPTQLINKTVTGALRNKRTVSQHFVMTPSSRKDS